MNLVPLITISVDLDGGGYVATMLDPGISGHGNTASIALLNLMAAWKQSQPAEPADNVIPFRRPA